MAAFGQHVHFAKASLRFRRNFGSGVPQGLTLGDRVRWALSTHGAKLAIAALTIAYNNQLVREYVLSVPLFFIGPVAVTPARVRESARFMQSTHPGGLDLSNYARLSKR